MTASTTTCPYCNAPTSLTLPVSARVVCPRCGESFAPRVVEANSDEPTAPTFVQEVERHRSLRNSSPKNRSRWLLAVVLLVALASVVVWSQWKGPKEKKTTTPEVSKVYTPEEMPGLRYLPAGTDSVIAVQFLPLLGLEAGSSNEEIQTALQGFGLPAEIVTGLEKQLGFSWDQIDQLVVGTKLGNGLEIDKVVAVLHLRTPLEGKQLERQLHATLTEDRKTHRQLYQTRGTPTIYWWSATPQTLVAALSPETLTAVSETPTGSIDHLDPQLITAIRGSLSPATTTWAILHSDKFGSLINLAALFRKDVQEWHDPVNAVRSVVVALDRSSKEPTIDVRLQMKAKITAEGWRIALQSRLEEQPDAHVSGEDFEVRLQLPANPAAIRSAMGR